MISLKKTFVIPFSSVVTENPSPYTT